VVIANCCCANSRLRIPDAKRGTIEKCAYLAAALTRQLLTQRKQAIEPRVLNLNAVVKNIERMLRRLIGEISNSARCSRREQATSKPSMQLEQVIMNLTVNARDAMPNGGKVTVTTKM